MDGVRRALRFLVRGWAWWVIPLVVILGLLLLLALASDPTELQPFVYVPR